MVDTFRDNVIVTCDASGGAPNTGPYKWLAAVTDATNGDALTPDAAGAVATGETHSIVFQDGNAMSLEEGCAYTASTKTWTRGTMIWSTTGSQLSLTSAAKVAIVLPSDAANSFARLASPTFTGTPSAPTPTGTDNSTKLATTAFVKGLAYATLASPTFTGTPAAPTATAGTSTTQIATTAFVATSYAPLASPTFTGTPAAPTPVGTDNSTKLATTAFVKTAVAGAGSPAVLGMLGGGSYGIGYADTIDSLDLTTTVAPEQDALYVYPVSVLGVDGKITKVMLQVVTGVAGATARIGFWADTTSGVPGTLLLEPTSATQIDCSSPTIAVVDFSSTPITASGRFWVGVVVQGADGVALRAGMPSQYALRLHGLTNFGDDLGADANRGRAFCGLKGDGFSGSLSSSPGTFSQNSAAIIIGLVG